MSDSKVGQCESLSLRNTAISPENKQVLHTSLKRTFKVVTNIYFCSQDENSHSYYYGNMNHKAYPDTMIFYHPSHFE